MSFKVRLRRTASCELPNFQTACVVAHQSLGATVSVGTRMRLPVKPVPKRVRGHKHLIRRTAVLAGKVI